MSDCPKHILSNCLNPNPLNASSWKSTPQTVLGTVKEGAEAIILGGIVDTALEISRIPEGINGQLKYFLGVDHDTGNKRPWSLSGLFRHYSSKSYKWEFTIEGNPFGRIAETVSSTIYEATNRISFGITYTFFNDTLGWKIKNLSKPPQTLREKAHWFTMGLLVMFGVRGGAGARTPAVSPNLSPIKTPAAKPNFSTTQPSFAASVSEVTSFSVDQLPSPLRNPETRPWKPEIVVPPEPALPKVPQPPTPSQVPLPLKHPLPTVIGRPKIKLPMLASAEGLQQLFFDFLNKHKLDLSYEQTHSVSLGKNLTARVYADPLTNKIEVSIFKDKIACPITTIKANKFGNILEIENATARTGLSAESVGLIFKYALRKTPENPLLALLHQRGNTIFSLERLKTLGRELFQARLRSADSLHHAKLEQNLRPSNVSNKALANISNEALARARLNRENQVAIRRLGSADSLRHAIEQNLGRSKISSEAFAHARINRENMKLLRKLEPAKAAREALQQEKK